jgi:GDPmannose 4,6-dehydratase
MGASVRDFVEQTFSLLGLDYEQYVVHDDKYDRATEVDALIGDATKAKRILDWSATTDWKKLSQIMVEHDLKNISENHLK